MVYGALPSLLFPLRLDIIVHLGSTVVKQLTTLNRPFLFASHYVRLHNEPVC